MSDPGDDGGIPSIQDGELAATAVLPTARREEREARAERRTAALTAETGAAEGSPRGLGLVVGAAVVIVLVVAVLAVLVVMK